MLEVEYRRGSKFDHEPGQFTTWPNLGGHSWDRGRPSRLLEAKICCPTFAITNALLGGMKLPVRIPRLDGLQGWPIFDSILFLADADDATELKNPISLFSFRFPRGERNGQRSMGNDGIKDGREEGGWAACTCARASRPPVSGGEIRSDRYVYS